MAQQPGEIGLVHRRRQQVVATDDLVDTGLGVVDHHGEVVGGDAIVASDDEVIDLAGHRTVE